MDLLKIQYIETNLIGAAILIIILAYIIRIRNDPDMTNQKYFSDMLISNAVILLSDVAIYLMRYHATPLLFVLNHIACIVYFSSHSVFGYFWFKYTAKALFPERCYGIAARIITFAPVILCTALSVASPFNGLIYSLTDENRYMRGNLIYMATAFSFAYWIGSIVITVKEIVKPTRARSRTICATLLIFPIPTVIGSFLQYKFYGLSITWICPAVSSLILFLNLQNTQISHDNLTGLYNRRFIDRQLSWEVAHLRKADYRLFLIMLDIDRFKSINDEYGHTVGDEALTNVSDILKKVCGASYFAGRFGGDEFLIIGHVKSEYEVKALIEQIDKMTELYCGPTSPYKLSVSTGYRLYSRNDSITPYSIISETDKEMYESKRKKALEKQHAES